MKLEQEIESFGGCSLEMELAVVKEQSAWLKANSCRLCLKGNRWLWDLRLQLWLRSLMRPWLRISSETLVTEVVPQAVNDLSYPLDSMDETLTAEGQVMGHRSMCLVLKFKVLAYLDKVSMAKDEVKWHRSMCLVLKFMALDYLDKVPTAKDEVMWHHSRRLVLKFKVLVYQDTVLLAKEMGVVFVVDKLKEMYLAMVLVAQCEGEINLLVEDFGKLVMGPEAKK